MLFQFTKDTCCQYRLQKIPIIKNVYPRPLIARTPGRPRPPLIAA